MSPLPEQNVSVTSVQFDLSCTAVGYEGEQLPVVTPLPKVNGLPLFGNKVPYVDTLYLLVRGSVQGEFDLCTCSCGVSGCAGFHEPVRVEVKEAGNMVSWHIPAEGYSHVIDPAFGRGPWVLHMRKDQLDEALSTLEGRILDLAAEEPRTQLSPFDGRLDEDEEPVAETLRRLRCRDG